MNRPWKIWLVFGLCLAVLLTAMGWVTWVALRLDRDHGQARQQAELEERVRLALWRMDSMLAPLIAQESARPYFVYRSFYAADRAYTRFFNDPQPSELLVPSPLLTQVSTNVLLHFQFGPDGRLTSPQVPEGELRDLATRYAAPDKIELAISRLRQFEQLMRQQASPELVHLAGLASSLPQPSAKADQAAASQPAATPRKTSWKADASILANGDVLLAFTPPPQPTEGPVAMNPIVLALQGQRAARQSPQPALQQRKNILQQEDFQQQQAGLNVEELQARAQTFQQNFDLNIKNTAANFTQPVQANVAEGMARPIWFGDALVLARRVLVHGQDYLQGCWLDWPSLHRWLVEGVEDLLPAARLEPLRTNGPDPQARMLASLPLRIVPGASQPRLSALFSPVQLALLVAWACVTLATLAVAFLLHGAVSLSERRGAFVSAVTHELRTPLTTFKMYSEMLADGMVPDREKQRHYLTTLCSEANRLSHLVENVLAYARLERGSARSRVERVSLGDLIQRVKPRLLQRAQQAGMTLAEDAEEAALQTVVHVDVSAVEQILFNLVDNACKYAAPTATEKIVHLEALPENGRFAMLRVRDHGQGITAQSARRLFKPFSKSAREAAHTAPGVGLGLALCRRLSRSMGGDLRLTPRLKEGACFELALPILRPAG